MVKAYYFQCEEKEDCEGFLGNWGITMSEAEAKSRGNYRLATAEDLLELTAATGTIINECEVKEGIFQWYEDKENLSCGYKEVILGRRAV